MTKLLLVRYVEASPYVLSILTRNTKRAVPMGVLQGLCHWIALMLGIRTGMFVNKFFLTLKKKD